jgi:hypothetical protein
MQIRVATREEANALLTEHVCLAAGPAARCACGWHGEDWARHRGIVLAAWMELRRRALRARLLAEEGVERP